MLTPAGSIQIHTGQPLCRGANAQHTNHGAYCSEEGQVNGCTYLQATKTGPTTPVPLTVGYIGGLFNALLDLTC